MKYSFQSRVRYSEMSEDRRLSLNGIINYFQDASTFQSEDIGYGIDKLAEFGVGWVLSSWQIVIKRAPAMGEEILISTWAYNFDRLFGYRNFTLENEAGEVLAYANSVWVLVDTKKGHPAHMIPEIAEAYLPLDEKLAMEYAPRKIPLPKEMQEKEPFLVRYFHLDSNHHVNNAQYVQMAREFIPVDFKIVEMRAEYKQQAVLGDEVYPKVQEVDGTYVVGLCRQDGSPFAVVQFL
ncbi:MAG: acyl-[acyl-carrier-protein] thioesterase [Lachnospiraceae bacterium]